MKKALIVYGTRFGAAARTAEDIAAVFRQQEIDTTVVDAKRETIKDVSGYDLVVVGSGIAINRWTGEPEGFLKKFQKQLASKKLALFVCCGSATSDKPDAVANASVKYLQEKAAKFNVHPAALGLFGGIYNFNKVPWYAKKALEMDRPRIEATYKATEPGIYDARDLKAIQAWAQELTQKIRA